MPMREMINEESMINLRAILAQAVHDSEFSEVSFARQQSDAPSFLTEDFILRYNVASTLSVNRDTFHHYPVTFSDSNLLLANEDSATFAFNTEQTLPLRSMLYQRNTENMATMFSQLTSSPVGYENKDRLKQVNVSKSTGCTQGIQTRINQQEAATYSTGTQHIHLNDIEDFRRPFPPKNAAADNKTVGISTALKEEQLPNASSECKIKSSHERSNKGTQNHVHTLLQPGNCYNKNEEAFIRDDTTPVYNDTFFHSDTSNVPESLYLPDELIETITTTTDNLNRKKHVSEGSMCDMHSVSRTDQHGEDVIVYVHGDNEVQENNEYALLLSIDDDGSIQPDPHELQELQLEQLQACAASNEKGIDICGKCKKENVPTFDEIQCDFSPNLSLYPLQQLMTRSRRTQEVLQSWDEMNGLPRSHSVTMMHTNRSRQQLESGRILPKWNGAPLIKSDEGSNNRSHKKRQRTKKSKVDENTRTQSVDHPKKKSKNVDT